MMLSATLLFLIVVLLSVSGLVLAEQWRFAIPLFIAAELSRIGLVWRSADLTFSTGHTTILAVELVTALAIGLILLVTAMTLEHEGDPESLDEFALMELRRAARRSQQRRSHLAEGSPQYAVPGAAVIIAAIATWLLSQSYPVARGPLLDSAWIFMLLCGILAMVTAQNALKLGLALLLLVGSAKLLYFGVASRPSVVHVALLEMLSLLLTIIITYLSSLLYSRLRTLELGSLFEV